MTEEFAIGLLATLAIGQLFTWIGYWHWRAEAKHMYKMNTALSLKIIELKCDNAWSAYLGPHKPYNGDSARKSQLSDEEREAVLMANMSDEEREEERAFIKGAIEEVDCGKKTIHPFMVEEPLPPGTVLHQEGEKCQNGMN